MRKIGLLTSGGDCQGLNAALRGVAKSLYEYYGESGVEIYGVLDGYLGLMEGDVKRMKPDDFSGILTLGGTILGTSRQPFKTIRADSAADSGDFSSGGKLAAMKKNYHALGFDCLVILGGNGTHKTANLLHEEGLRVVTLPKTIDNDIYGTDFSFGFQSAVDIAANVLDCIHSTASSHGRVFIVELMGHKAGWLTLFAGISSGADVILLPEIPYDVNSVAAALRKGHGAGRRFSIIAAAEGILSREEAAMSKKQFKESRATLSFPSVSYRLAGELGTLTGQEIRVTVPGHFQRGGSPCPADRTLATRLGAAAAKQIIAGQYGVMMGLRGTEIVPVPLGEVAGKLKLVPVDSPIIEAARMTGVSFGDETTTE